MGRTHHAPVNADEVQHYYYNIKSFGQSTELRVLMAHVAGAVDDFFSELLGFRFLGNEHWICHKPGCFSKVIDYILNCGDLTMTYPVDK